MTTTTTTTTAWTNNEIRMFSALKNMFTINPTTGAVERKNDKESEAKLMSTIIELAMGKPSSPKHKGAYNTTNAATGLPQIITWPGGKKNELKGILANVPSYDRYFEPFVGGGSVFMGTNAKEHYINDFCSSLMDLYQNIATTDDRFFHYLQEIDRSLDNAKEFSKRHWEELAAIYEKFRSDVISKNEMIAQVSNWCEDHRDEILDMIGEFTSFPCTIVQEVNDYLGAHWGKFCRLKSKNTTDIEWIEKHISAAVSGAIYRYYRNLFNNKEIEKLNIPLHSALMVYIHQFCFSGMFKYDKKGNFNNSFGGISYLKKRLKGKISHFKSKKVREHFQNAHLYNYDFEEFLNKTNPQENDFIFLDPPYDEMFSAYDDNEFNRKDHKRLADYLLNRCKSKWMMIINKTDFILDLYNQPGIHIQAYDKTYTCSAKYNDDRDVIHLLITNYDVNEAKSSPCELVDTEHTLAA